MHNDLKLLVDAGIGLEAIASLLSVTSETVRLWTDDKQQPNQVNSYGLAFLARTIAVERKALSLELSLKDIGEIVSKQAKLTQALSRTDFAIKLARIAATLAIGWLSYLTIQVVDLAKAEARVSSVKEDVDSKAKEVAEKLTSIQDRRTFAVSPAQGWQSSGIRVVTGDVIRLRVSGGVHVAANQMVELQNTLWAFLRGKPDPKPDDSKRFRRYWSGPEGTPAGPSPDEPPLLFPDGNLGQLYIGISTDSPPQVASIDPQQRLGTMLVHKAVKGDVDELCVNLPVAGPQSGYLMFIVNDRVQMSPDVFNRIRKWAGSSQYHVIPPEVEALIYYQDNIGGFLIELTVSKRTAG